MTAVKAGRYKIRYVVVAGLDGKARAVSAGGGRAAGRFAGTVSNTPPNVRVADDGKTIIEGQR